MANKKISDLDTAASLDGSEMIPVVKAGNNFKILLSQIKTWFGLASASNDGLMAAVDKQKLTGIQANATQNSTDISLRDRSTHTGTQAASTIVGLKTVATSGSYSDLSAKPDLTPAGLGVVPTSHVGSGGTAHALATVDAAGFMSPAMVTLLAAAKQVAFSADYKDLLNTPWNAVAPMGFTWWPDYNTDKGSTHNDYNSFGVGLYHGMAATGTKYKDATEYHTFTSSAVAYAIAGLRSAMPVAKVGAGLHQGGFVYEAIVHWAYVAGSCMIVGLSSDPDQAYGNWSGADIGIAVGWNASETGASTLKVMTGNGTVTNRYNAISGTLQEDATYRVRIEVLPTLDSGGAVTRVAKVTVTNLDTGVSIVNGIQIPLAELPPAATPLYAMIEYGTLTGVAAVSVDMLGWSCERYRGF